MFQWCLNDGSVMFLVMLFVMSRFCLGGVSVMSWVCVSDVSVWLG